MSDTTTENAELLLEAAREANINLPKGKKACLAAAKAAVEDATEDEGFDQDAALKALEDKFGMKKAAGKRKAAGNENEQQASSSAKGNAGAATTATPDASVLDETWEDSEVMRKEQAAKLVDIARSRGIKMPKEDKQARMGAGRSLMGIKDGDSKYLVRDVIEDLEGKYGRDPSWVDPDDTAPKKKPRPSKAKKCENAENEPLADMFDELAGLLFKEKSRSALVYKKVVSLIKDLPEPMKAPPKKKEIPGIGPKCIDLIKEFLETGTTQLLEEKRQAANEM